MSAQPPPHGTGEGRRANRLIHETSPYLLQHAYNPVDWYPWNDEALRRARALNRPILLSIGYSACHWCHVMERESFEDERIAALMNEQFVCIKVDREERPDLDEIYMQATLQLNHGQGGWPMTVFLTPEQQPIFAGTYFPPTDRWGRPGFGTVLEKVAAYWREDQAGLRQQAGQLTERLKAAFRVAAPTSVGEAELDTAVAQLKDEFEPRYGGFGHAPKFPPAATLSLLLRRHRQTGDSQTLHMVRKTLDAMAAGGLYDQIGGGFARYSTDDKWLVPHFEKMLYDNALLTRTYLEAVQATGDPAYRRIAAETLDYVLREMTSPEGGFYSATDADSEGVEGKFFVWTPEEIRAAVPTDEDARRVCAYFDITPDGNWEHRSIPNRLKPVEDVARELDVAAEDLRATIHRLKPLLYEARRTRVPPGLDDKVLTAWNGMMIGALALGARILEDTRYLSAAEEAADFLLQTLARPDGGLYRTYRAGKAHLDACLEDYAYLAEGLIDLYEAGAHEGFLGEAVRLAERILADFSDTAGGGFFTTAAGHEALIVRSREGPDGATPSGSAVAAAVLARLSFHFGRDDFREAAIRAVRAYGKQIKQYPRAFAKSLAVLDFLLAGPTELALVGTQGDPAYEALRAVVNRTYLPNQIVAHVDPLPPEQGQAGGTSHHPLLAGKGLVDGKPALYICRHFACERPVTDPTAAVAALRNRAQASTQSAGSTGSRSLAGSRLPGYATPGGTGRYAVRFVNEPGRPKQASAYTAFGTTGLSVSRLGFGGYRTATEDPDHRAALVQALRSGCNLIDTSTNYGDGESERLVGSVLAESVERGSVRRDEIVVVSKIGYVQGENLRLAQARETAGRPYPDMVKYGDGIWHCLHPDFLADQLALSLDRLGLETLDVLLLHNVEYFLSDAAHRNLGGGHLQETREQFYARLRAAFAYLETQIEAGRIRWYGVSSNTCTAQADDPEATSLSRMLDAARQAATPLGRAAHGFRILQCPMNLFEAGALLTRNTGPDASHTVLETAQAEGLAVLLNRPLNAMPAKRGGMMRLAKFPLEPAESDFETQLKTVASLEADYRRDLAPLVGQVATGLPPEKFFTWADELARLRPQVHNLEHWEQIEAQMIAPHVNQVLRALAQHFARHGDDRWDRWRDRYVEEFLRLLRILRREATVKSREQADRLSRLIDPLLPEARRKEPLSRKALWVLASTPGVTSVLNGMRTPAYVEDSLAVLEWEPLAEPARVFNAVKNG